MADNGRLLVQGTHKVQHEGFQLAKDIDNCFTESYYAWQLLNRAEKFIPSTEIKNFTQGTKSWWTQSRLSKWLKHFDRFLFLHSEGNTFIMGESPTYRTN